MSRNLGRRECAFCHGSVLLEEPGRPITPDECRPYIFEFIGRLTVANAKCEDCGGKYLAWISMPGFSGPSSEPGDFVDLSFRKAFNDEPAPEDFYEIHPKLAQAKKLRREAEGLVARALRQAEALEREVAEDPTTGWEGYLR